MNANQLWMRRVSVKYGNAVTLVISLKGRFKMRVLKHTIYFGFFFIEG
jgi:hypothetical protein